MSKAIITLAPYSQNWPLLFAKEKEKLKKSIAKWVNDIQHVGSTSVPNLLAKPTIDILIGVDAMPEVDQYVVERIKDLGYDYIKAYEKDAPYRRYFQKLSPQGEHLFHIHVVPIGCEFWNRLIFFRDYLKTHPNACLEYEQVKKKLAKTCSDRPSYTLGKSDFIRSIENKMIAQKEI